MRQLISSFSNGIRGQLGHTSHSSKTLTRQVVFRRLQALLIAISFILIALSTTTVLAKNIKVDFHQVPQQARNDFYQATNIIEQCVDVSVPIKIKVVWIPKGPTGFAVYRPTKNQAEFLIKNAWYPSALAHQLRGQRDSNLDDMNLFFSAQTKWYFKNSFDNNTASDIKANETDFINVALHEILHGLGLSSATYVEWQKEKHKYRHDKPKNKEQKLGAIGLPNEYINYFTYSFGKLELDGTPALYDTFIRTDEGDTLFGFANPSAELADKINGENFFHGPNARRANNGNAVPLVSGNLSHIDINLGTTPIMLPNSGIGESVHQLDPIAIGMLKDLGWKVKPRCLAK